MILSRVMRAEDVGELVSEAAVIDAVVQRIQGQTILNTCPQRKWEYAMALKALTTRFDNTLEGARSGLRVADFGCGIGLLSPALVWLGCRVRMHEVWQFGDQEYLAKRQMEAVGSSLTYGWTMVRRPLGQLSEMDRGLDAAFCISTLEHIPDYETAFRDLCRSVRVGGLVFLTTDFAEDERDHYVMSNLRAGRMFTIETYRQLLAVVVAKEGMELVGGEAQWAWDESCRLVHDYGFASMALTRKS